MTPGAAAQQASAILHRKGELSEVVAAQSRLNAARNRVQSEVQNLEAISNKHMSIDGEFMLNGAGESVCEIVFGKDIAFTEKPILSHCGEIRDWERSVEVTAGEGHFPTVSVVVVGWITVDDASRNLRTYLGVRLAVVVTGWAHIKMFIHWKADGMAVGGPVDYDPQPLVLI